jgi:hypothetical protein
MKPGHRSGAGLAVGLCVVYKLTVALRLSLALNLFGFISGFASLVAATPVNVTSGSSLDYQPSVIRTEPDGLLMVVFERIEPTTFHGDLFVTFSDDEGATWTLPVRAVGSSLNERHPSLVQLAEDSYVLMYLVDETGVGSYRIHRATSSDGISWTEQGPIDLGWSTSGEINPCVVHEGAGVLTMSYQRSGAFIARSLDGGVSWDHLRTQISTTWAALPRLAWRSSDNTYVVSYQINPDGNNNLDVVLKTSTDPYLWSGPEIAISADVNSHDSQPAVLADGPFIVSYARVVGSVFDVYYRTSCDGLSWSDQERVTDDPLHYDTQPHPIAHLDPSRVKLLWSHQVSSQPYEDHDVIIDPDLLLAAPSIPAVVAAIFGVACVPAGADRDGSRVVDAADLGAIIVAQS